MSTVVAGSCGRSVPSSVHVRSVTPPLRAVRRLSVLFYTYTHLSVLTDCPPKCKVELIILTLKFTTSEHTRRPHSGGGHADSATRSSYINNQEEGMQQDEVQQQQDRDALFGPRSRRPTSSIPPSRGTREPGYNSNHLSGAGAQLAAQQSFSSEGGNEFNSSRGGWDDADADAVGLVRRGGRSGSGHGQYGGRYEQQPQREQQQLSWAQVRDSIDVDERRRGLRSAHESAETGRATLESLQDQKGERRSCVYSTMSGRAENAMPF